MPHCCYLRPIDQKSFAENCIRLANRGEAQQEVIVIKFLHQRMLRNELINLGFALPYIYQNRILSHLGQYVQRCLCIDKQIARSEERRVGKECRSRLVTGVQTCALPISDQPWICSSLHLSEQDP